MLNEQETYEQFKQDLKDGKIDLSKELQQYLEEAMNEGKFFKTIMRLIKEDDNNGK